MIRQALLLLAPLIILSCSDNIVIERGSDFTLTVEPYRTTISRGEAREFSVTITSESTYEKVSYTLRQYQTEGEGTIILDDGRVLQENTDYLLSSMTFKVRYISASDTSHSFTLVVSDNLGHTDKLTIELANS